MGNWPKLQAKCEMVDAPPPEPPAHSQSLGTRRAQGALERSLSRISLLGICKRTQSVRSYVEPSKKISWTSSRGNGGEKTRNYSRKKNEITRRPVGLCSPKCSTYISHHQVTGGRALYSIDSHSTQTPTRVRRKSTPSSPPPDESPRDTYQKHTRTHTCTLLMSLARACTLYSGCMAFVCTCLRACDFSASRARLARRAWAISIQPASSIDASVSALCVAAYDAHALAQWFWK